MLLGGVALVAGISTLLFGADLVLDSTKVAPGVDSEMRFYAAWYAAAGVLLLRAVPRVEAEGSLVRWVGAAFFVAGCARLLSLVAVGRPPTLYLVLMVAELALPAVIIPWQSSLQRQTVG
ncbi:MAG: hypothetical protein QOG54_841 [Actinomycetota bacterium]|jgi:hypothetical protein|nr:hypothetical protein [Actinomycetota bacterium]